MRTKTLKKRIYTSLILLFLIFIIFKSKTVLVFCLMALGVLSLLEFFNIIKKIFKNKFYIFISSITFIIYICMFCYFFFFFSIFMELKIIIFSLLLGCAASDIGGFLVGKTFKGPKLTKVSPNKTISGSFGSLILTCIVFSTSIFYFTKSFDYKILIIAITTSIACQLGDLFFSFLKRKSKTKDTGNFFPGHGGVLDRLDGILLGIPIGFITLILFY